jgi:uncharacterized lipoprotein
MKSVRKRSTLRKSLILLTVSAGLFAGCATAPARVDYTPSSVMSATGSVSVVDFRYIPFESSVVASNQIKNTALGKIEIDKDVKDFFRDAVVAELRIVGIKLDSRTRMLGGDISEFIADDLGFTVNWTLRVRYLVKEIEGNKVLFESEKVVQRRTAKINLLNRFGALNETIKLNVEQLLKDPEFIKVIQ